MKLIAAKCPSCGANVKVDRDLKFTKCEYCDNEISVEEAVENLIQVELKDNPTLDNYLLLGERYFSNKEFEEAYKVYSKAEEIDPNNPLVVLRKGLSKSMLSDYNHFEVSSAINGLKNSLDLMNKMSFSKKDICESINETGAVLYASKQYLVNIYKNNKLDKEQSNGFIERMEACLDGFIYLDSIVVGDKNLEVKILDEIIETIDYLLGDGKYNLSSSYVNELMKKRTDYIVKREKYGAYTKKREYKPIEKVVAVEGKTSKIKDILCYVMMAFLFILFLGSIFNNESFIMISIWLVAMISFLPQIKKYLIKKYGSNVGKIVIIFRIVIVVVAIVIMGSAPMVFENTYQKGDTKITLNSGVVTIEKGREVVTGSYQWDSKGNNYFIHVTINEDKLEYKYQTTDDGGVLCVLKGNNCDTIYLPIE